MVVVPILALATALGILLLWTPYQAAHPGRLPLFGDGGVHALLGSRLLHGQVPLRDLWTDKPPGVFFINAAAFALGGPNVRTLQLLDLGVSLISLLLFFRVALLVSRAWTAALMTLAFALLFRNPNLLNGGNYTEQYALPLVIAALGCALTSIQRRDRGAILWVALTGLFLGVATTISLLALPVLAAALASFAVAWRESAAKTVRQSAALVLGFALPVGTVALFYAAIGAFSNILDAATFSRLYSASSGRWVLFAGLAAVAVATAVLVRSFPLLPARIAAPGMLLAAAFVLGLAAHVASGHYFAHHILAVVVPAATLMTASTMEVELRYGGPSVLLSRAVAIGVGALVIAGSTVALAGSSYRPDPAAAGYISHPSVSNGALPARIDALCPPDTYVYVWGNQPAVNFLANRQPPSRYVDLFALQMPNYDNQRRVDQVASDLHARPPCAVVDASPSDAVVPPLDADQRTRWSPSREESGLFSYASFQPIYDFVSSNYKPASGVDGYDVWVPKASARS